MTDIGRHASCDPKKRRTSRPAHSRSTSLITATGAPPGCLRKRRSAMRRRLWLCLAGVILTGAVHARDFGQWETMDPEIKAWYQNLRQPDSPAASCCGEADAYFCGNLHTKTDYLGHVHNFCTIDDDRDNATLRRSHIPNGTEIEV